MSIFLNKNTKVVVQGITGEAGSFHTKFMKAYGTKIVCGVTPGKGGQSVEGVPVFNTIKEALEKHRVEWSIMFVPAPHAREGAFEALENNLNLVIITEHIPVLDTIQILKLARRENRIVLGPNCPGICVPDECLIGIMPGYIFKRGKIGIVSRSGTLTYEIVQHLSETGLGESTVVGCGGDPVMGIDFIEVLKQFEKDPETEAVVLIGEIGGDMEERASAFIKKNIKKKVVAYIAGKAAPEGKTMGHAGAIISGGSGTFESKVRALESAGVKIARFPKDVVELLK